MQGYWHSDPGSICRPHRPPVRLNELYRTSRTLRPIVSDAALKGRRVLGPDFSCIGTMEYLEIMNQYPNNGSMIGFAVEAAILSACTVTGLPIPKLQKRLSTEMFSGEITRFEVDLSVTSLHTPGQFNFPFIDAIACVTEIRKSKPAAKVLREANLIYEATLFLIQITLDPSIQLRLRVRLFQEVG